MKHKNLSSRYAKKYTIYFFITLTNIFILSDAFAQPGTLDSSFGAGGKVIGIMDSIYAECTALQSDGKIIIEGQTDLKEKIYPGIAFRRFTKAGVIDSSFGLNGRIITDVGVPSYIKAVVIQGDGKIIAAGFSAFYNDPNEDDPDNIAVLLIRYNRDGGVDSSFGNNGIVISDFSDYDDEVPFCVALQADGKIIVGGYMSASLMVTRYLPNGKVDSTFNDDGYVFSHSGGGFNRISSIAIQTDGKIVAAGQTDINENSNFILFRYKTNGTLDSSFGIEGQIITNFGIRGDEIKSLVLQPDGKIVVAGVTGVYSVKENIAVARYLSDGSLDNNFGEKGKVTTVVGVRSSIAVKVFLQEDGKIIVAGNNYDLLGEGIPGDFVVIRYNKNGSLDISFGIGGISVTDISMGGWDYAYDALLQPDGKTVVVGDISGGIYALVRYNGDDPIVISLEKNITRQEGNSGYTTATFNLVLNKPSATDIKVTFATQKGTAKAGSDYIADSSTLDIKAGRTKKNVRINIIGDTLPEHNEKFYIVLSNPVKAVLGELDTASCTIKNDDATFATNIASINNSTIPDAVIRLYPNPVKNSLQIDGLSATQQTILSITDLSGNRRVAAKVTASTYNWNISQLKTGSYILKVQNGEKVITRMFIKE